MAKEERSQPDEGFAMGKGTNPQCLTLANINALLEQEREKHLKILMQFFRDPHFLAKFLNKPYLKDNEFLKFNPYDGKKKSVMEHISKFINTMGPNAGHKELCLREFAKSLINQADTWYTTLRLGSIRNWDDMIEKFCAKYYSG